MEIITVYAIAAGGLLSSLAFIRALYYLSPLKNILSVYILRHLTYPFILHRHRFVGPWTRAGFLLCVGYFTVNLVCLFFLVSSASDIGRRAGNLSLVNMPFLFAAPSLSFLADVLGISLQTCRRIHHSTAWMSIFLLAIHIAFVFLVNTPAFSLQDIPDLYALIASSAAATIVLLSFPIFRRNAYECFLRSHQGLAALFLYAVWRHLPPDELLAVYCVYISAGIFISTLCSQLMYFIYRNGFFTSKGYPRAYIRCGIVRANAEENEGAENAVIVRVVLPRPMKLDAGQYVNLWMPTVNAFSWTQIHPFMVTSWSQEKQSSLDFYIKSQTGLSATLYERALKAPEGSVSFTAFITGLHGISHPIDHYGSVLLLVNGPGIAAVLPYLRKLIHGYNTSTCRTRRIHLVWELKTLDLAAAAEEFMNSLLKEDTLTDGYIFTTSIYVELGKVVEVGNHGRGFVYPGRPDYDDIIQTEASGDFINSKLEGNEEHGQILAMDEIPDNEINGKHERGQMLVMVSLPGKLRDQVQSIVRKHLRDGVAMTELEFQPD